MTRRRLPTTTTLLCLPLLGLSLAGGPVLGQAAAPAAGHTLEAWAHDVWAAARRGDLARLEAQLDRVPAGEIEPNTADRFKDSLAQLRTNRDQARSALTEQRTEALTEMRSNLAEENLAMALRKAVEAQSLSDDFNEVFADEEIMRLVAWAESQEPEMEAKRRWLDAQELLYLLRTFYEDTDRRAMYDAYDERLENVNRRVALLARYVPRRLHEMRNERAERLGEESFGEFNPLTAPDWHERIDGVNGRLLTSALRTSAAEHIEQGRWRPLLEGGLEALRLFATTTPLAETFPSLGDPAKVEAWSRFLDRSRAELARLHDAELTRWTAQKLIDDLLVANGRTLGLDDGVILREFGDGAMDRLDTYSEIIWPDKLRRFEQQTQGNFVGVGILIRHNDKREIMVVNPLEGTPAYYAGVKPNDVITTVEGDATVGWSLNDAVDRITGPKGTTVHLGVQREGVDEPIDIAIERDVIKIRSVKGWYKEGLDEDREPVWDWYMDPMTRVAYIRLTQFTEDTYDDLRRAWREISAKGAPGGLVLDLRHNPGGLLTSAVRVSNLFLEDRVTIVSGEDSQGRRAWTQDAHPNRAELVDVPTVVLVNKGSASASEIVAGALQAHGAAIVVGERSFGKGSVQTVHHVAGNGRLKLTTQYYRLPSPDGGRTPGRLVHKRPGATVWGVDPDMEVKMTAQQVIDAINLRQSAEMIPLDDEGRLDPDDPERPDVNDLLTKGIDPQLETALLILQAQALAAHGERHALRDRGGPPAFAER